jgi:hypothetical protein
MPKEAFGGDDDSSGGAAEKKKMGLSKFGLSPDTNIRDIFWRIMGSYAATKKAGEDLATLGHDRFSLMRAAVSVLSDPGSEQYGLAHRFLAVYSVMMLVDGGWKDAFVEFLERGRERRLGIKGHILHALRKLLGQEEYGGQISEYLAAMVRGRETGAVALEYISELESPEIVRGLKKELIIIARGDIGDNQLNAIRALSLLKEDEEIKKSMIILLSHWDAQARYAASEVLLSMASDKDVKAAAERRLAAETDEDVKKVLGKIAKNP